MTDAELPLESDHDRAARAATLADHRRRVAQVARIVRAEPWANVSVNDMAEMANLSPFHFSRVFHQIAGASPGAFHSMLRIDAAKRLLLTTDEPVIDVCYNVGYNSLGSFTARFASLVGLPPAEYRRRCEQFDVLRLHWLRDDDRNPYRHAPPWTGIRGQITLAEPFDGVIFVGMWDSPHARAQPLRSTMLLGPGEYHLAPAPDGEYYVMACAIGWSAPRLEFLTPDNLARVGISLPPIVVRGGYVSGGVDIALRPFRPEDTPLLISLPLVLERDLAARGVKR